MDPPRSTAEPSLGLKNSYARGKEAEDLVRSHFEQSGYFCVGQRVTSPVFEVDLILENDEAVYLVEVKTISNWGRTLNRLPEAQKRRLLRSQIYFSSRFKKPVLCRLVLVDPKGQIWSTEIY